MANKKLGFVPVYRSIQEHWLWSNDEPFDRAHAWIDLLLSVNHEEKKIRVGCSIVTIKPGQMWTSYVKLAQRWGWSKKRVIRFFNLLKSDGMIYVDGTANGTLLTLVNYSNFVYQGHTNDTANDTANDPTHVTANDTADATQTIMNNNVNNDRKVKKESPSGKPDAPAGGGEWQ